MAKLWSAVTRAMWTDKRFIGLSAAKPNAQTLWIYLLTNPHQTAIPGLFPLGAGTIGDDLEWPREEVKRCLKELEGAGMIEVSLRPALILLPNSIRHNQPSNPNQIKGWRNGFDNLPETPLRDRAILAIREGLRESLIPSFDKIFGEDVTLANQRLAEEKKKSRKGSRKGLSNGTGNRNRDNIDIVEPYLDPPVEPPKVGVRRPKGAPPLHEAQRLAEVLRDAIATHSPEYVESKVSEKTLKSWSVVIDRMLRLDKSEAGQIEAVIRFAHINDKTEFWRSNLMSGVSLRKQFHRLLVQCRKKGLLNPHATEADWKTEYGTWAIRIAERSLITTGKLTGSHLIENAKLEGVPAPPKEQAEAIASWAVKRV
jgi:hypothetical protein